MTRFLLVVGVMTALVAAFPIYVSPWLSREVQWLAGVLVILTGLALGEVERIVGRK